jgi:oligopeptide/dipeptide ABC transporter ATP-binding protein
VFTRPRHPYTALLLASAPSVRHDRELAVHQLRRTTADPEPPSDAGACVFAARCPFATGACAVQPPLAPVPEVVAGPAAGHWSAACRRQREWPELARERPAVAAPR